MANLQTTVITIVLVAGALVWAMSPAAAVALIMANKPVTLKLSGQAAYSVGSALKLKVPAITTGERAVSAAALTAALVALLLAKPLVDLLNVALGRGYSLTARYHTKGAGILDDELVFKLVP